MAFISEKYRKTASAFFLLFYLAGAFQGPVLEALHSLSHWSQTAQRHHFHHHSEEDGGHHGHHFLELVGNLLAPFADEPAPASDTAEPLKKKLVECISTPLWPATPSGVGSAQPQSQPLGLKSFFPAVPTPPPRCTG